MTTDPVSFRDEFARRVGSNVKLAREEKGLTREGLAVKAEVSHGTVQSVEQGRTIPRPPTLAKIAWALGKTPDDLMREPPDGDDVTKDSPFCKPLADAS